MRSENPPSFSLFGFRKSFRSKGVVWAASVVCHKFVDIRLYTFRLHRGGTGARGHRNEEVPSGPNRRKPHSTGSGWWPSSCRPIDHGRKARPCGAFTTLVTSKSRHKNPYP